MKNYKLIAVLASFLTALFFLSAATAVPILCRGWYYYEAENLKLAEKTGFSTETIHESFEQLMDYLVKDAPFGAGTLKWSESGRAHFADCKALFRLDFLLAAGSALGLLILALLRLRGMLPYRFLNRSPCFWAFAGTLVLFFIFGIWAIVDFNSLFTAFHTLFFPGKTNWIFDAETDPVILLLPEAFWAHTAALVAGLALAGEALAALAAMVWRRVFTPKNVYETAQRL